MRHIAVLGANGTGKTWLAGQLAGALDAQGQDFQIKDDPALSSLTAPCGAYADKATTSILLLGLDLMPPTPTQMHLDQALRLTLTGAAVPFQVIYGQGQQRLINALQALQLTGANTAEPTTMPAKRKPWVWACEKCSDPVCEHRLLSDLLAKR